MNGQGTMSDRVDDQDGGRTRRIHRHTDYQIQQLENYFKVCPYPTETQRLELGRRLNMEPKQVKYWFQNKRNRSKKYMEHLAKRAIREEHDRLRGAQERLRSAIVRSPCIICGGSKNCRDIDDELQRLMFENAILKRETDQFRNFLSYPIQLPVNPSEALPSSSFVISELVKLAERMTRNYFKGIIGSPVDKWESIQVESAGQNIKLMIRKNVNEPGEHTGVVLSAASSFWLPVNQQTIVGFLSNQSLRHEWDSLTKYTSMEETMKFQKEKCHESTVVSLLRILGNGMLVLEEIWNGASGASLVYAPVETYSMDEVRLGANSDSVQLLPSGFSILPDHRRNTETSGGCLLTLGLQILLSSNPTAELTQGSVKRVEELVAHTIRKIKSALHILT